MAWVHHIVAGIALVLVLDHFSLLAEMGANPSASAINSDVLMPINGADRSGKGDRLLPPRSEINRTRIVDVEIVGLHDAAIVYRDRKGRVLFHNDPLTSTTIAAKNVDLPEVTIRDRGDVMVRRTPPGATPTTERSTLRVGCDPAFGPLVDPSLRVITGRCLTENRSAPRFAALW
jgi:hypothetical protein